jgi:hypothetical protein
MDMTQVVVGSTNGVILHPEFPRSALVVGVCDQQWRQVPSPS